MARNDKNYWLAFGENAPGIKTSWRTLRKRLPLCAGKRDSRNCHFQPAVYLAGAVGKGKLMVIGNPHYNSILRCRTVTAGKAVLIKAVSVCVTGFK